jgi:hypothetical protein
MWFFNYTNDIVQYAMLEMCSFLSISGWLLITLTLLKIDGDDMENLGLPEERAFRKTIYITYIIVCACAAVTWGIIVGIGHNHDFFSQFMQACTWGILFSIRDGFYYSVLGRI